MANTRRPARKIAPPPVVDNGEAPRWEVPADLLEKHSALAPAQIRGLRFEELAGKPFIVSADAKRKPDPEEVRMGMILDVLRHKRDKLTKSDPDWTRIDQVRANVAADLADHQTKRLADFRVTRVLNYMDQIKLLGGANYRMTERRRDQIARALMTKVQEIVAALSPSRRAKEAVAFSLDTDNEQ